MRSITTCAHSPLPAEHVPAGRSHVQCCTDSRARTHLRNPACPVVAWCTIRTAVRALHSVGSWTSPSLLSLLPKLRKSATLGTSTSLKRKIQALRAKIAFHVPPIVNSPDCETPGTCLFTWNREREERVRLLIHQPEHPISCLALLDQLRNVHVPGLCDGCQGLTVRWIWGKCLLTQEETLIDEAVASLMVLQVEQPLRQALRESVINFISTN
ncbi:hypothetical protein B0H14DRAFT_3641510 [Mycena olivaceomarginata]|nr:hypothetical protein B0H14DRAFT_3641510 [Mycena olivaceomarginata]